MNTFLQRRTLFLYDFTTEIKVVSTFFSLCRKEKMVIAYLTRYIILKHFKVAYTYKRIGIPSLFENLHKYLY